MKKILLSLFALFGAVSMAFAGDGSASSPYTVAEYIKAYQANTDVNQPGVYVTGYIVGNVANGQSSLSNTTACWGNNFDKKTYSNILLGGATTEDDVQYVVAVQLVANTDPRTQLNLGDNPQNIYHQVTICGTMNKYFGACGMRSPTSFSWVGEAPVPGEGGGNDGGNETSGLTFLAGNMDGWTIDNVQMEEPLTYIWAEKEYNGSWYMNGSAFMNNTAYPSLSYLISPVIEVPADAKNMNFEHAAKFQTTLTTLCGICIREEGATDWTALTIPTWPTAGAWTFANSGDIDISAYAGKKVQVAFKYGSSDAGADTWEVKNLVIGGTSQGTGGGGTTTPTTVWSVAEALSQMAGGFTGKAQVKGYVSSIDDYDGFPNSYGNATYFLVDNMGDSQSLEVYRGYGYNGNKITSESDLQIGALVTVEGELVYYNNKTYEFTSGSKIISYVGPNGEQPGEGGNGGGNDNPGTTPEQPTGETVTFDFTVPSSLGAGFSDEGEANQEVILTDKTLTSGVVSLSFTANEGASTQARLFYGSGGAAGWTLRFYKDTQFTVSVDNGYILKGIEFNGTNIPGVGLTMTNGQLSGTTWTPNGGVSSVTFSKEQTGNNPTVKTMTVYYSEATGVDEVFVNDDAEAVYFNLQGVRVNNPERGIFIKVVNGKATKVVR